MSESKWTDEVVDKELSMCRNTLTNPIDGDRDFNYFTALLEIKRLKQLQARIEELEKDNEQFGKVYKRSVEDGAVLSENIFKLESRIEELEKENSKLQEKLDAVVEILKSIANPESMSGEYAELHGHSSMELARKALEKIKEGEGQNDD